MPEVPQTPTSYILGWATNCVVVVVVGNSACVLCRMVETKMAKITMAEISKIAGVSLATVSRTIHSPHLVRKETRERINQVMEDLWE